MLGSNIKNFFAGGTRGSEMRQTRNAWDETQAYWRASPLAKHGPSDFAVALVKQAMAEAERAPATPVLVAVCEAVEMLYRGEDISDLEALWPVIETSIEAAIEFRQMLPRRRRWAVDYRNMQGAFTQIVLRTLQGFFNSLPESCFGHWDTARYDTFETPLLDLLDEPAKVIDDLFMLPYDDASFRLDIFNRLRELCVSNMLIASGFLPTDNPRERQAKLIRAPQQKNKTGAELAQLYLNGSPLKALLDIPVPFHIPEDLRFEHCHIVGGTGHGKTQLMQKMIHADLLASRGGRPLGYRDRQSGRPNQQARPS